MIQAYWTLLCNVKCSWTTKCLWSCIISCQVDNVNCLSYFINGLNLLSSFWIAELFINIKFLNQWKNARQNWWSKLQLKLQFSWRLDCSLPKDYKAWVNTHSLLHKFHSYKNLPYYIFLVEIPWIWWNFDDFHPILMGIIVSLILSNFFSNHNLSHLSLCFLLLQECSVLWFSLDVSLNKMDRILIWNHW